MQKNWAKSSNNYSIVEVSQQMDKLPVAVYKYQLDIYKQPYLAEISPKFDLPDKIYDTERAFINRVKRSWSHTEGNFGILLNGVKGTGKSITAKIIANEMDLPVIILPFKHETIVSFINEIQQDVVIFIDEYDKIFDRYDHSLLSVMDGVMKTESRIMFLLTSNEIYLDKNMLQRPSRIRYVKSYKDLSLEAIIEIVDDLLIHKHLRDVTIKFISKLSIITMDLVKSIIQEVNIHEEDPIVFGDVFNISDGYEALVSVYKVIDGKKEEFKMKTKTYPYLPFTALALNEEFYVDGDEIGDIVQVTSENEILVEEYVSVGDKGEYEKKLVTYVVDDGSKTHRAFNSYAF